MSWSWFVHSTRPVADLVAAEGARDGDRDLAHDLQQLARQASTLAQRYLALVAEHGAHGTWSAAAIALHVPTSDAQAVIDEIDRALRAR